MLTPDRIWVVKGCERLQRIQDQVWGASFSTDINLTLEAPRCGIKIWGGGVPPPPWVRQIVHAAAVRQGVPAATFSGCWGVELQFELTKIT